MIRGDRSPIRDYVYVKDAVAAYLPLAECMNDAALHARAFNIGTGEPVSVLDLTRLVLLAADRPDLKPNVRGNASHEIPRQYLSADLLRTVLGLRPGGTLTERLRDAVAYYRTHAASL